MAFKFPREPKPEQSMGWTIDYGLISQIAEDIGDQEFIPSHEGIELVLLSLEGIYAAPVESIKQEPVAKLTSFHGGKITFLNESQEYLQQGTLFYTHPVRTKDLTELLDVMVGMANYIDKLGGDSKGFRVVIAADREKNK